jgi:RNA polymerase sigma-70 factor (ECF subfamily)
MDETDKQIIERVMGGDARAFGRLVDRHKAKAMAVALRILRNREEAEEALQDAFVRMYKALSSFEWKSSFSTWLYRIVYNTCITALGRRSEIERREIDSDEEYDLPGAIESDELQPDMRVESDEVEKIVLGEIDKLPASYGTTFTLFAVQEMSYEEIVDVMGLPLGTVKARIFRARMMLRNAVARRLGDRVVLLKDKKEH